MLMGLATKSSGRHGGQEIDYLLTSNAHGNAHSNATAHASTSADGTGNSPSPRQHHSPQHHRSRSLSMEGYRLSPRGPGQGLGPFQGWGQGEGQSWTQVYAQSQGQAQGQGQKRGQGHRGGGGHALDNQIIESLADSLPVIPAEEVIDTLVALESGLAMSVSREQSCSLDKCFAYRLWNLPTSACSPTNSSTHLQ